MFWDSVKRYLFTPCCVLYALFPLVFSIWHPHGGIIEGWPRVSHFTRGIMLLLPNLTTAFLFQSYMLNIAAAVRKKLYAMKGLTFMLSPVCTLYCFLADILVRSRRKMFIFIMGKKNICSCSRVTSSTSQQLSERSCTPWKGSRSCSHRCVHFIQFLLMYQSGHPEK